MYPVPPNAKYGGATDRYIGEWIKGIQRDKIILATKVVYISCPEMSSRFAFTIPCLQAASKHIGKVIASHFSWLQKKCQESNEAHFQVAGYGNKWIRGNGETTRITKAQIEKSVDDSLKRLKTDYIDLLQVCSVHENLLSEENADHLQTVHWSLEHMLSKLSWIRYNQLVQLMQQETLKPTRRSLNDIWSHAGLVVVKKGLILWTGALAWQICGPLWQRLLWSRKC